MAVEESVAGHLSMDRGKRVGIEAVAGLTEDIVAGAGCMFLSEVGGCGNKVKNKEIVLGACGRSDVEEGGGD